MTDKTDDLAADLIREYEQLSNKRGTLESHWEEIARRMLPSYSGLFTSKGDFRVEGQKRTEEILDSTAVIALERFASVMESMLTPQTQTWHKLRAQDRDLNKVRAVALWFDEANRVLFDYRNSPRANFVSQNFQDYVGLGAFGTSCMFVDQLDKQAGLRYRAIHLGEVFFAENHQGQIDKVLRRFSLTARQAIQKWGADKLPDAVKTAMDNNRQEEIFWFLHCVKPREDVDPTRRDYKGMPWASYYVSIAGKKLISEGGYQTFPYSVSRYWQAPGEVYGRSPAMNALPAVKTLNSQKSVVLKQGHRSVDPVLLLHDDGVLDSFSLKPGAANYGAVTSDGKPLVHTLPVGNIAIGKELMDDERAIIKDAFLITLFQILTENPQMTATEVLERAREKGMLVAPTMGRQQSEKLGPMIERELDLLSFQRLLPPMPRELVEAGGRYAIVYDSPLSRAQRAEEGSGTMRSVEFAMKVAVETQDPEPLDHFDWDTMIPDISDINGTPPKYMRDAQAVLERRKARKQAQTEQQAVDAAPAVASVAKTASQAQQQGA